MHTHDTHDLKHDHHYISGHEMHSERRTLYVVALTAVMMVVEIVCGILFNSMALLADGWHMATHTGALGIAAFAYYFARKQAKNPQFTFGTGKVNALGGFTSAIILAIVALMVAAESILRLASPSPINFDEAIIIACIGLAVNIVSALLLQGNPHHHHDHDHDHSNYHEHDHHHHDHNLKAAYLHVLADAFTSVLAIVALLVGKYVGWVWMDPLMGILGSIVIAHWSIGLMHQSAVVLLDQIPDDPTASTIRTLIESDSDNSVTDLHLWQIAPGKLSAVISIVTDHPKPPEYYKTLLHSLHHLVHISVEVNPCKSPL